MKEATAQVVAGASTMAFASFRSVVLLLGALGTTLAGGAAFAQPRPAAVVEGPAQGEGQAVRDPVEVRVVTVVPTPSGQVVLLKTVRGETYLPIWVGDAEAFAIQLRLARQRPERPLTHDLLDSVLRTLDAHVIRVVVVDIRDGVFFGRIDLRARRREHHVDARSSDSIAIALGSRVPIYVATHVLAQAGLDRATLERDGYQGTPIPLDVRHSL